MAGPSLPFLSDKPARNHAQGVAFEFDSAVMHAYKLLRLRPADLWGFTDILQRIF